LYRPTETSNAEQDRLVDSLTLCADDDQRSSLEEPPSLNEMTAALRGMKTNKSPGIDGLPVEFYRKFWDVIGEDLHAVYCETLSLGRFGDSQRTGVVRLLYKKGDKRDLKNWRPITLLTVDYKILAKVLANRLSRVLPSVIHVDQTCSVPGRSIRDNCRLLQDVVDFCNLQDIPAALVSLDQAKAFDRVDWKFLDRILCRLNLGPLFRRSVSTLYNSIRSRIVVNGWLSRPIYPGRGVRQGCPLSPLLYVLTAETLGSLIRSSPLRGLRMPSGSDYLKVSQYADDTTVVVGDDEDFTILKSCLTFYELGSGAELNFSKTCGLFLGPWRQRQDSPLSLAWSSDSIRLLGIRMSSDPAITSTNWQDATDRMTAVFNSWKRRELSLVGRAVIANTLAASKLWYVAQLTPPTLKAADAANSTLWKFIWADRAQTINRSTCCLPVADGGLGGIILRTKIDAFQLEWFARLIDDSQSRWKCFATYWFERMARPFTDLRGLLDGNRTPIPFRMPPFYCQILRTFRRYNGSDDEPRTLCDATSQSLFGNPRIVGDNGRPLFSKAMADAGVATVANLSQNCSFIDIDTLKTRHGFRGPFLYKFLDKLHRAIPEHWLTLPDRDRQPPALSITVASPLTTTIPLSRAGMYRLIMRARQETPIALASWQSSEEAFHWQAVWSSISAARLHTPYDRDIAFKFIHRVLPTPDRRYQFGTSESPSCALCRCRLADIVHVFRRCPSARLLRIPLRRVLSALLHRPVPSSLTLFSAPLLPRLSLSSSASFVVWIFLTTFWKLRETHSSKSIASIVASRIRQRINDDWYAARRHRLPDSQFFQSQWMPPGAQFHLCRIEQNDQLTISFGSLFSLR
jgi:hypothetical protein